MSVQRLLKLPQLRECLGQGTTSLYDEIKEELLTPPIKLGRSSLWPEQEIKEIQKAMIAGKSDDERRELVKRLVAARAVDNQQPDQSSAA
jgi:prophage regulatory protein